MKQRLLTPGPSPVPEETLLELAKPVPHHRTAEFRQILNSTPRSVQQLVGNVNKLRANTKAYVRVWRPEPNFQLEGEDFPDPPPSLALILGASQNAVQARNSKLLELEISAGDAVISGAKSAQVEIKE